MDFQLKTPVALIIFSRPETTSRVFEEIRKARPPLLLVVADGPRIHHPEDKERCAKARAIIDRVDWPCEVSKNYSDVNLGCRERVSSGLTWVFQRVEEAIILEDDCLPDPTFFQFCEELIERYRNDEKIGHIGGANIQLKRHPSKYSYYFSRYNFIWGWASWRRAWKDFDVDLKSWPEIRRNAWLKSLSSNLRVQHYWQKCFDEVYRHKLDTWDYQWNFHCWIKNRLAILPNTNLISNIGFNKDATHTVGRDRLDSLPLESMKFPLSHPPSVVRDEMADKENEIHYDLPYLRLLSFRERLKRMLRP